MTVTTLSDLDEVLTTFKNVWVDSHLLGDIATELTCTEFEVLRDLLEAVGVDESTLEGFDQAHAEGDDCGDVHCLCDDCKEE